MSLSIKQTRVVDVPVTELRAAMDVACVATLLDAEGVVVGQSTTPTWLPQVLQIDLESGRIINWRAPSAEQLQAMADSQEVVPTMPADMVDRLEKPYTILDLMRDNSPDVYESEMRRRNDASVLYPATNTSAAAQTIDVVAPVQAAEAETAPESQQPKIIDIELPADFAIESVVVAEPVVKKPSIDIGVSFNKETGRWVADVGNDEVGEHSATSQQGKFEAIKNVLKKAGLHGVYEINQRDAIDDVEFYSYDDTRTKDRLSVYVSGFEGNGYTARTSTGQRFNADSPEVALHGLLRSVLKVSVPLTDIINTTDDCTVNKTRYSIDMSKAVELPEVAGIEPAPEAPVLETPVAVEDIGGRGAVKPRYHNPTTGETWTGRGKQPTWLQAAIADGANINDFLIPTALLKKPLEIVPAPEPAAPPTYTEVMAAIEYAATEIHAAKLVNTINGGGFDFDQRTRLHAALNTRIKQIKAAEPA